MKKLFFLNGWGGSDESVLNSLSILTPNNDGVWKGLIGTINPKAADYFIALEANKTNTPIDKTLFIEREPNYIRYNQKVHYFPNKYSVKYWLNEGYYCLLNNIKKNNRSPYKHIIDFKSTNTGSTHHLNKTYEYLLNLEYPNKAKKISCVASTKHNHRNNYIKRLFKTEPDIDLYGRGHDRNYYGDAYKGELNYDGVCKFKGLVDYEFSIVLENCKQKNYWTEKLADAYLSWCMPIYWGCPNISEYFPENSFRLIDIESENPLLDINEIINQPLTKIEIEALRKARRLILDEYNIWEIIHKKIKDIESGN